MKTVGINLHIYPSTFSNESRILKETQSLIQLQRFEHIYLVGVKAGNFLQLEKLDEFRTIIRFPNPYSENRLKKIFHTSLWLFSILFYFRKMNVACVNCHNISVLPIGLLFKLLKSVKLIYDAHELETETHAKQGTTKYLLKFLERCSMPFIDRIIVVNELIGQWYKDKYKINNIYVVRNIPHSKSHHHELAPSINLKNRLHIPEDEILFIYQGALREERGVYKLLNVFAQVDKKYHIIFMGFGPLKEDIQAFAKVNNNIHFMNGVSPEAVFNPIFCLKNLKLINVGLTTQL